MTAFKAPAKINLSLQVTGRRNDGYHLLESLVTFTGFGDLVEVKKARTTGLVVKGPFSSSLENNPDNLVLKAAHLLEQKAAADGIAVDGVEIVLTKNLPVASGIGGGSADAAATLHALCDLWQLNYSRPDLLKLALQLGADVPMCMYSTALIARGIGEKIEPVSLPELNLLLVNPGVAVSAAEVFGRLRLIAREPFHPMTPGLDGLVEWLKCTGNDLEAPALTIQPVIQNVLDLMDRVDGCLFARMSGSGATCFGIFSTMTSAERARYYIMQENPNWWCVATSTITNEVNHARY